MLLFCQRVKLLSVEMDRVVNFLESVEEVIGHWSVISATLHGGSGF